jgi:hypothetical protein
MGKSERVEGQASFYTAGGPTGYLFSATIQRFNSYLTEKTLCFHLKYQLVNAAQEHNDFYSHHCTELILTIMCGQKFEL